MHIDELLPPFPDITCLEEYLAKLENAASMIKKEIETLPEGSLSVSVSRSTPQFYIRKTAKEKKGKYISKKQTKTIKKLAQKKYLLKTLPVIKKEIALLKSFIFSSKKYSVNDIYKKQNLHCQSFITPVTLDNQQLLKKWQNLPYSPLSFVDDSPVYLTFAGIRVRSKSEIIIAESLHNMNIAFYYEYPVKLKNGKTDIVIHPDFTCLNYKTHQIILWEHFGMMDNPEYAKNAVEKINLYAINHFVIGKNLICSFETSNSPINTFTIKNLISTYF